MSKSLKTFVVGALVLLGLAAALALHFAGQQQKARQAQAVRQLQQWGIALNLYLLDNDNILPERGALPISPQQTKAWYNALPPYLGRPPLAELAPGERPRPGVVSFWVGPVSKPARGWDENEFFFGYAMNGALQPSANERSFKVGELGMPGKVIFLGETSGFDPVLTPQNILTPWGPGKGLSPRSLGQILFCDGHVEAITRAVLVDDPATRRASNLDDGGITWFLE